MDARPILAAALLLLTSPLAARAGCCTADPGGLDVDPTATPLRVAHDRPATEVVLTWESPRGADTQVWQGDLDQLWMAQRLNDFVVDDTPESEWRQALPAGNAYYLLNGSCNGLVCTRGRNSEGNERSNPWCEILERGALYPEAARCLRGGEGIVRDAAEYAAFITCFAAGTEPAPLAPGEALVWATDHSNAACGTCLEFTCASGLGAELSVERRGQPWGDCDAIHDGGAWARVPAAPIITLVEEMPPFPAYGSCP